MDLGEYAFTVLSAYAATLALLAALIGWTLWSGAQVRRELAEVEARLKGTAE